MSSRTADVFPGSRRLVRGTVPPSSMLLIGPTGVGKTTFCEHFIYNGLRQDRPCIFVATNESPDDIHSSMQSFGFDIHAYLETQRFRIVDCYSCKVGGRSSSEYAVSSQRNYLTEVTINIDKARQALRNFYLVFDSVTDLTTISNQNAIFKFLQIHVARIRASNGTAFFTVAAGAHDEKFMNLLGLTFDGILEMKVDETGTELKRLIRVFSLKGAKHRTSWTPFEITDNGILVKRETELRCALCSKLIEWEPHTETIDGRQYQFDTEDCANTYKRFKNVYGEYFE